MMAGIRYLDEFYKEIQKSATLRRRIVTALHDSKEIPERKIRRLEDSLTKLEGIPWRGKSHVLLSREGKKIDVDLGYEIEELKRDILFLRSGEKALIDHLKKKNTNIEKDILRVKKFLGSKKINSFITDRDGTVNNYCARYMSSVQSVYNAFFLSSFARDMARKSVIMTSAPLEGIVKMSTMPKRSFVYAGSKGREYLTRLGKTRGMALDKKGKKVLDSVTRALKRTLAKPDNNKFFFIGSGFQKKFGQITIARQDVNDSVPRKESENFLTLVKEIVSENDPEGMLSIEDTGLDIEIILNHEHGAFTKGDGVDFLSRNMRLNLEDGNNLVCGDTSSDIPMATKTAAFSKKTKVIFVTGDEKLKRKVSKELDNVCFVKNPDILVTALYRLIED